MFFISLIFHYRDYVPPKHLSRPQLNRDHRAFFEHAVAFLAGASSLRVSRSLGLLVVVYPPVCSTHAAYHDGFAVAKSYPTEERTACTPICDTFLCKCNLASRMACKCSLDCTGPHIAGPVDVLHLRAILLGAAMHDVNEILMPYSHASILHCECR